MNYPDDTLVPCPACEQASICDEPDEVIPMDGCGLCDGTGLVESYVRLNYRRLSSAPPTKHCDKDKS